ncbi:MAG: NYN domain-containing protein [Patescibacteria group bacterium]
MVIKHPGQRVAIFIDVQNLYHSAKNLYQARVNFGAILKLGVSGRNLIRAFAYVVRTKTGEEKPFFDALIKLGIETKVRDLQEYFGGLKKADWDVGITVDAIRISPSVDTIVLVSGDGDFLQLIEYLRNQGKRVEVIAFGRSASAKLKDGSADEFIDIEESSEKYLLKKQNGKQNL